MTKQAPVTGFSASERDYIRRELDMFFSTLPTVAEGFQLKIWRGGPQAASQGPAGRPMAAGPWADASRHQPTLPRLFFTEAGLVELRAMVADRRLADPKRFAHVRQELGIDLCRWRLTAKVTGPVRRNRRRQSGNVPGIRRAVARE